MQDIISALGLPKPRGDGLRKIALTLAQVQDGSGRLKIDRPQVLPDESRLGIDPQSDFNSWLRGLPPNEQMKARSLNYINDGMMPMEEIQKELLKVAPEPNADLLSYDRPAPRDPYSPNNPQNPPDGWDGRRLLQPTMESRFDDARAYRTADAGPFTGLEEPPAFAADAVQNRRVSDDELAQRNALNGLSAIMEEIQSNPELLEGTNTLTGRGKTALLRLRDRLGVDAVDLGPEGEQYLGDVTGFRQKLLTNVNQYIKDITGATVGQGDETKRLMAVQANEGDSPTEIIAKLGSAMNMARLNMARSHYMQREGGAAPSDKELRDYLGAQGKRHYEQALASGLGPDEARMKAAETLSEEFGF